MTPSFGVLDNEQRRFCEAPDGPVRLLAPAGCGKTLSLLWRCRSLLGRSTKSPKFLIFTFTRAAREELQERIRREPEFADLAAACTISTLNAWGWRRLKGSRHGLKLLTSKADRYFCVTNVLQPIWSRHARVNELLTESRFKGRATNELLDWIDKLKTLGFRHDRARERGYLESHIGWLQNARMQLHVVQLLARMTELRLLRSDANVIREIETHVLPFWADACEHMAASALVTIDDQKYLPWLQIEQSLAKQDKQLPSGAARYDHVVVDEFQDINPLDLGLLRAIVAQNRASITLVGDDDQAIYEWRGASPEFILDPDKYVAHGFTTFVLATNYRSPRNIVDLSQRLIAKNERRVAKSVRAHGKNDAAIEVFHLPNLAATVELVVQTVEDLFRNRQCASVALVGRKRSQIIPYQIVFAGRNIPFYAAEDLQVFLSDAFSDLKAMLAILARSEAVGIGTDSVQDILSLCDKVKRYPLNKKDRESVRRFLLAERPRGLKAALATLGRYTGQLKGDNADGRMTATFVEAISPLLKARTVAASLEALRELEGLQKDYGKAIEDIFFADPPFLHLAEYAQRYGGDYESFYEDLDKAESTLARIPPADDEDGEPASSIPIHLMTALRAKGKEFDAVIVLDANDGIWPSSLATTSEQLEQERRLFYVAVTRARKRLMLLVNDSLLGRPAAASPYVAEMGLRNA